MNAPGPSVKHDPAEMNPSVVAVYACSAETSMWPYGPEGTPGNGYSLNF